MSKAKAVDTRARAARTTLTEAVNRGRGVERPFNCPKHDDTNASASLNVVKNVWFCFACGASGRSTDRHKAPSASDVFAVLAQKKKPRVFEERWLDVYDATGPSPYWVKRVGDHVARLNRTGTDPMTGYPTYPVRDPQGQVLGVVWRTYDPELPKYLYPPAVSTSQTLFGYSRSKRREPVILVEGASDVMAIQAAFWSESQPLPHVVGVYGSGLHHPQVELIRILQPTKIIAAFDADDAGRKAALRAQHQAATHLWPFTVVDWEETVGATDPGEAPVSEVYATLKRALEDR